MKALVGLMAASFVLAACAGPATTFGPTAASLTPTTAPPASAASPSAAPAAVNDWPFVRLSCPGASAQPLLLVALGTSETAGSGIKPDEAYSPQAAYPAQYADILCKELGVTVELHSYFPAQLGNELAPLAWWNERVATEPAIRADLAAARIVVLWAMSAHDIVPPLLFGGCSGDWPNPLKGCFESAVANVYAETDRLFGAVSELVPKGAKVLAADAYVPPAVLEQWAAKPYWDELRGIVDPRITVMPLSTAHGFTFVDTEAVFNGPSRAAPPASGLFQSDGLHPTAAGALLTATVFAGADGLGG